MLRFVGIVGDSNTMCYNSTAMVTAKGAVGTVCTANSDCLYGLCVNGMCAAPPLFCPTTIPGTYRYDIFYSYSILFSPLLSYSLVHPYSLSFLLNSYTLILFLLLCSLHFYLLIFFSFSSSVYVHFLLCFLLSSYLLFYSLLTTLSCLSSTLLLSSLLFLSLSPSLILFYITSYYFIFLPSIH